MTMYFLVKVDATCSAKDVVNELIAVLDGEGDGPIARAVVCDINHPGVQNALDAVDLQSTARHTLGA